MLNELQVQVDDVVAIINSSGSELKRENMLLKEKLTFVRRVQSTLVLASLPAIYSSFTFAYLSFALSYVSS